MALRTFSNKGLRTQKVSRHLFSIQRGSEASHSQVALVPDLSRQNTTFLIPRSETSATGFVAGSVPHWNLKHLGTFRNISTLSLLETKEQQAKRGHKLKLSEECVRRAEHRRYPSNLPDDATCKERVAGCGGGGRGGRLRHTVTG